MSSIKSYDIDGLFKLCSLVISSTLNKLQTPLKPYLLSTHSSFLYIRPFKSSIRPKIEAFRARRVWVSTFWKREAEFRPRLLNLLANAETGNYFQFSLPFCSFMMMRLCSTDKRTVGDYFAPFVIVIKRSAWSLVFCVGLCEKCVLGKVVWNL